MRRYARTLAFIVILVVLAGLALGYQYLPGVDDPTIRLGNFERGGSSLLGLELGLDLQGGTHLVYQASLEGPAGEAIPPTRDQMDGLIRTIERRVNGAGLGEPILQLLGEDRLLIQLPGVDDPGRAKRIIGETARLEFKHRILEVEQEVLGLTADEVVSFQVGTILLGGSDDPGTLPAFRPGDSKVAIPLGPVPEETPTAEETPAAEGTPTAEETPAAEGTPAAEETPTAEGTPAAEETPTAEGTPAAEETPTAEGTPAAEETPVAEGTPAAEETPTAEGMPTAEGTPTAEETPAAEGTPTPEADDAVGAPAMVIELQPSAAAEFRDLMGRLEASLVVARGAASVYPNFLSLAVEGQSEQPLLIPFQPIAPIGDGTFIPLPVDPQVRQVPDTDKFLLSLGNSIPSVEDALERFAPDARLVFTELFGKVDEDINLTGEDLARAYPGQHNTTGLPIINIEFNSEGTRKFGEITSQIAGTPDLLAIVLDDEELIAPRVNQPITRGVAFIEGRDFTFDRVSEISLLLEGGRLPVPIALIQERNIDAILGADSLAKSVVAGLVGLGLVLAFMVAYYRIPGLVASAALVIYAALLLSVFKMMPVTLTLSGVAAVILSIGMAVDANILIFERMKEELRAGRTLLSAINIGFNRAWPAIRDGNVSTLITCAILFWFADTLGATIVQGFAITLAFGVLISMFTAIIVSRTFLRVMAATAIGRRLGIFAPAGSSDLPRQQEAQAG